jgi:hypothetical protein
VGLESDLSFAPLKVLLEVRFPTLLSVENEVLLLVSAIVRIEPYDQHNAHLLLPRDSESSNIGIHSLLITLLYWISLTASLAVQARKRGDVMLSDDSTTGSSSRTPLWKWLDFPLIL